MELRHIRYFLAVARELHFGRAAVALHIAQPALSQQIQALERELGVQLLERTNHRVCLTAAGRVLLEEGEALLQHANAVLTKTKIVGQGKQGLLRISLTRSAPAGQTLMLIDAFRARYPEVDLHLSSGYTGLHLSQLRAGEIDLAFVRPPLYTEDIACIEVEKEELVVVVPKGHPLTRKRHVACCDLVDLPIVSWPRAHGPGLYDRIHTSIWGEQAPRIVREEPEEGQMARAVAQGIGITIMTRDRACCLGIPGISVRRFVAPVPTVALGVAWRPELTSATLQLFLEVTHTHLHKRTE